MNYFYILSLFFCSVPLLAGSSSSSLKNTSYAAVISVPVADLIGQPLPKQYSYTTFPICGGTHNPALSCLRIHQALFNTRVTVIQEKGDEVLVDIPNAFYVTLADKKTRHTHYWTLKKNITPLSFIAKKKLDTNSIPLSATLSTTALNPITPNTITLVLPFYEAGTGRTFSAGTRFVRAPHAKESDVYNVFILNPSLSTFNRVSIPKKLCIDHYGFTLSERIHNFVQLLHMWVHSSSTTAIPYVWGGASFTTTVMPDFTEKFATIHQQKTSWYEIKNYDQTPKTGVDCSNMIMLAAQIVGIPYFYKNTTTVEAFLPRLADSDRVQDGDIIAIPRHVMVVSSVKNNTLIEARSYPHGYGKVQELPLNKVFYGINTYDELQAVYKEGKSIQRLNSKGEIAETLPYVKLFSLSKIVNNH